MKTLLLTIGLAVCSLSAVAQVRLESVTVHPRAITNDFGAVEAFAARTNSVAITNGEAARVVYVNLRAPAGREPGLTFWKSGLLWGAGKGDVIHGPATLQVTCGDSPGASSLVTLERFRVFRGKVPDPLPVVP